MKKIFSFKINKLSTTDNISDGKPAGVIDRFKISLIDGNGNEISSNFKISIVLQVV